MVGEGRGGAAVPPGLRLAYKCGVLSCSTFINVGPKPWLLLTFFSTFCRLAIPVPGCPAKCCGNVGATKFG